MHVVRVSTRLDKKAHGNPNHSLIRNFGFLLSRRSGGETEECQSKIDLYVNRLTSQDSVIPFEYSAFDFCTADDGAKSPTENLGQVLFGEVSF